MLYTLPLVSLEVWINKLFLYILCHIEGEKKRTDSASSRQLLLHWIFPVTEYIIIKLRRFNSKRIELYIEI